MDILSFLIFLEQTILHSLPFIMHLDDELERYLQLTSVVVT